MQSSLVFTNQLQILTQFFGKTSITRCIYAFIVTCPMLGSIDNGTVTVVQGNISTALGGRPIDDTVVVLSCNTGFTLIGANQSVCLGNGQWSDVLPVCQRKLPKFFELQNSKKNLQKINVRRRFST